MTGALGVFELFQKKCMTGALCVFDSDSILCRNNYVSIICEAFEGLQVHNHRFHQRNVAARLAR